MTDQEQHREIRWTVPPGADVEHLARQLCRVAQPPGLPLTGDSHAAVHLIADTLADDVVLNGTPPITVCVKPQRSVVTICVTDGRDYRTHAARTRHGFEEIRALISALDIHPADGRTGCTLSVTIPVRRRRTLRSRLVRGRRGRP